MAKWVRCWLSFVATLAFLSSCIGAGTQDTGGSPPPGLRRSLLLTEIMANQAGTETGGAGEFVELFNAGETTVNLDNLVLAVGPESTRAIDLLQSYNSGTTRLLPGGYAVILDPDYDGRYALPGDAVMVTVGDSSLGAAGIATNHYVTLYDENGVTIFDQFRYPSDPGDGVSLYRISLQGVDGASNWVASPSGSSPGKGYDPANGVTSFPSFWVDRFEDGVGRFWFQAIGWPPASWQSIGNLVGPSGPPDCSYRYRYNLPAASEFQFTNRYSRSAVVFYECTGPTDRGTGGEAQVRVEPGTTAAVPASSLGYYFACTDGPGVNETTWDNVFPWATIPPDGTLATFIVEVPGN